MNECEVKVMVVCPKCRSGRTAPILYGYPSHEAFEAEERGELILGGCEMIDGIKYTASNDQERLEKAIRKILKEHGYKYFVESEKHDDWMVY